MVKSFSTLRIKPDRMLDTFNQLALIGATGDGGVSRVTFSEDHLVARKWFRNQIESSGLEFRTDGAGNHSAFLACDDADAPTLLVGSHLDSVPNGGRFDGALGVIAALEVLRTVKENLIRLKINLEAIDFTDEEGTLVGLLGSAAIAGTLHPNA
jgi:N-carbamoyl-L-amino-acid hydrolase